MLHGAIAGLASGGLYAIIAVCLVLMLRLVRVVNFAQTAVGMFGAFSAVALSQAGVPPVLAFFIGLLIGSALSGLLGLVLAVWFADATVAVRSAVAVAALLLLIATSFIGFGTKPLPFAPIMRGAAFDIGGASISLVGVVLIVGAVVVAVVSAFVLRRTMLGVRLRALSERPIAAELLGLRTRALSVGAWVATGFVATLAVSIVAPNQSNNATSLALLIIPASAAALAGAFRRLDLAVVGGLALGALDGALSQSDDLVIVRYFVPFLALVVLSLWLSRKEVWDAAR